MYHVCSEKNHHCCKTKSVHYLPYFFNDNCSNMNGQNLKLSMCLKDSNLFILIWLFIHWLSIHANWWCSWLSIHTAWRLYFCSRHLIIFFCITSIFSESYKYIINLRIICVLNCSYKQNLFSWKYFDFVVNLDSIGIISFITIMLC